MIRACAAMSRSGLGRVIGSGWKLFWPIGTAPRSMFGGHGSFSGTAEGCGTMEIMRRAGVSKPCVWRWQRRFMEAGVDGL